MTTVLGCSDSQTSLDTYNPTFYARIAEAVKSTAAASVWDRAAGPFQEEGLTTSYFELRADYEPDILPRYEPEASVLSTTAVASDTSVEICRGDDCTVLALSGEGVILVDGEPLRDASVEIVEQANVEGYDVLQVPIAYCIGRTGVAWLWMNLGKDQPADVLIDGESVRSSFAAVNPEAGVLVAMTTRMTPAQVHAVEVRYSNQSGLVSEVMSVELNCV